MKFFCSDRHLSEYEIIEKNQALAALACFTVILVIGGLAGAGLLGWIG